MNINKVYILIEIVVGFTFIALSIAISQTKNTNASSDEYSETIVESKNINEKVNESINDSIAVPQATVAEEAKEINTVAVAEEKIKIDYNNVEVVCKPYYWGNVAIRNSKYKIEKSEFNDILNLIANYPRHSSFYVLNLDDSMLITHNATEYMFGASIVKLPYTYYCVSEIEKGTYSLDEKVQYEERFRHGGSGILSLRNSGDYYTIKELLHLIIHYSDNTAYYMLHSYLNLDNYKKMMSDQGFQTNVYKGMPWDSVSAFELGKVLTKIYENCNDSSKDSVWNLYADELKDSLDSPLKNTIGNKYAIASKSGWAQLSYHESGIVYAKNPYIIVVMTKSDGEQIDRTYVANIITKIDELLNRYNAKVSAANEKIDTNIE